MEIYLDNSATTPVAPSVREIMLKTMTGDYGNPSSMHGKGVSAEHYIRTSAETIASALKADSKDILFTSGGTEANNLAILGSVRAARRRGNHLITSAVEHPSVLNPCKHLEQEGFDLTVLPVDAEGRFSLNELIASLREDTLLVSLMAVNNEIGTIEPIREIGEWLKANRPDVVFHVDATQALGKMPLYPKRWGIHLLTASGHKIHGPKGIGFLYADPRVRLEPIVYGGGQERGLRSGTENVPGIAGLGEAVRLVYEGLAEKAERMQLLRDKLAEGILQIPDTCIHGIGAERAPHIVSAGFAQVRSEVLLHSLEEKEIYVSAGSACSTHKREPSHVLKAIGADAKWLDSTLRFSLSDQTTEEDVAACISALTELVPVLRRFVRR